MGLNAARSQDRRRSEEGLRCPAESADPRRHSIAHRRRQGDAFGREHLGNKERVSAGRLIERRCAARGDAGEFADGTDAQRRDRQIAPEARRDLAKHRAQGMPGIDVVAPIGSDQEHGLLGQPSPDDLQHVERRAIRPMEVLEDQHAARGLPLEQRKKAIDHAVAIRACECFAKAVPYLRCHVDEWRERTRRDHGIARSTEDRRAARQTRDERVDQGGFADPGFAGNHDQPTVAGAGLGQTLIEVRQERLAFEQAHTAMLLRVLGVLRRLGPDLETDTCPLGVA
jgi:hypothetical protein